MTGQRAPPSAGTRPIGSVKAMTIRITASARIAVPQMTVQVRQIWRNRGTRAQSPSQSCASLAGRIQARTVGSRRRRPSSSGRDTVKVAGRLASRLRYM